MSGWVRERLRAAIAAAATLTGKRFGLLVASSMVASSAIVAENPEQKGEAYIKAQQNLPDVIVIGGDPSAAPAPTGQEP